MSKNSNDCLNYTNSCTRSHSAVPLAGMADTAEKLGFLWTCCGCYNNPSEQMHSPRSSVRGFLWIMVLLF